MKKLRILLSLLMLIGLCFGLTAFAEDYTGGENWQVILRADGTMTCNFSSNDIDKIMNAIEPGDSVTFTVSIMNANSVKANWYMSNQVLYSLEDRSTSASGGAYEYTLSYIAPNGTVNVLYSSDTVGGEGSDRIRNGEGLHGATSALEDFFFLDTLESRDKAQIKLVIALDGESQGNNYQDTMADLQINFAAEYDTGGSTIIVDTGEHTGMLLWFIVMLLSGGMLLFLTIRQIKRRREAVEA